MKMLIPALVAASSLFAQTLPRVAPELSVLLTSGKKISIDDYRGKVILVAGLLTT